MTLAVPPWIIWNLHHGAFARRTLLQIPLCTFDIFPKANRVARRAQTELNHVAAWDQASSQFADLLLYQMASIIGQPNLR